MTIILFWDIDGTLLTTGRAGIFAWEDAVREVGGQQRDLQEMPTAGLTDVEIARRLLQMCGWEPAPDLVGQLLRRYEAWLPARLPLRAGRVFPGVKEILAALCNHPQVHSLLLTGNTAEGARAKLTHYGLWSYFSGGAFAEDGGDRAAIASRALEIASQLYGPVGSEEIYVIGDTPHDIACGHAIGARAIAVATGPHSVVELAAHDPWWVIDALPDPKTFVEKVFPGSLLAHP